VSNAGEPTTWRGAAAAIGPGQTAKLRLHRNGKPVEAFVVNHEGRYHAYVNRCPHAGTTLDWWPNEFFTDDGRHLICATHGAVFAPDSGLCLEGPCPGARLERLACAVRGDTLVVAWPR
jgi:nitrite reductase/ring-hydroxylating ferredoxin subunit